MISGSLQTAPFQERLRYKIVQERVSSLESSFANVLVFLYRPGSDNSALRGVRECWSLKFFLNIWGVGHAYYKNDEASQ